MDTEVLEIGTETREKLRQRLKRSAEFLRFEDEPSLASLCTCLGLQFELGKPAFDRLSPFFGVEEGGPFPLSSEIIVRQNQIGIRITRTDGCPLQIRHPDFVHIIDPESFNSQGELAQILIFPSLVAENFHGMGLDLVVVRDWVLTSSLHGDDTNRVVYTWANEWEVAQNIARTQATLMTNGQLAFSGTHDIVDHLLNANPSRFSEFHKLFIEAGETLDRVFSKTKSNAHLVLSYLVGILLDDLAQPKWYGSEKHEWLMRMALKRLEKLSNEGTEISLTPSASFHRLVSNLRAGETIANLQSGFEIFLHDIFIGFFGQNPLLEAHQKSI